MARGLGDITDHGVDPIEMYYRMFRQGVKLPRRKWTKNPDFDGCDVPALEKSAPGLQQWFECHVLPRQWQMLADLFVKLQEGVYTTTGLTHLTPPLTSRVVDLKTDDAPVAIGVITPVVVLTYTVPDRFAGSFKAFGNGICSFQDWSRVLWTIQVNKRPIPGYQDFRQQIGDFMRPTDFPSPTLLKHGDVVEVTARLNAASAVPADVFARATIYVYAAKDISQAGDFAQYKIQT